MIDFHTAVKAKIPFVGVHTDDPVNAKAVLQALSGKTVQALPHVKQATVGDAYLWWTESLDLVTSEMYRKLADSHGVCVVINPDKPSLLVLDVGTLPTPTKFVVDYLQPFVSNGHMDGIVYALRGLSVKTSQEVVQLTMARSGEISPKEVRKTRQMLGATPPGLTTLETDYDFYDWPLALKEWLDLNDKYFLDPATPQALVPRGLLLAGDAGTGKTMASMALARHWGVPLLRLDVSLALNRFLGASERHIADNLNLIEQASPCVWLLDEVEKLFGQDGDEGTTLRILSQLLWWLQSHKVRVLSVFTTNDISKVPKELYRAERLDRVIVMERLGLSAAKVFAFKVYESILAVPPTPKRVTALKAGIEKLNKPMLSHAEVRVFVAEMIKANGWCAPAG